MKTAMTGSVSVIREWEPANPVMCAKLIEYITEKMAEFHAPCLFCRFSREAYTVDTGQRDALANEIKDLTARLPGKDKEINCAGTDDIMMTVRLPEKHKRSSQGPPPVRRGGFCMQEKSREKPLHFLPAVL